MGNIRQAKKNRSSAPRQKPKRSGMLKSGKKKINVLGNAIIAENWCDNLPL
jgi:nucleolar protein 16